jgi:hypothetical protein
MMDLDLSHLPDDAIHVSEFGGKDYGILELDTMSLVHAVPHHGCLIEILRFTY